MRNRTEKLKLYAIVLHVVSCAHIFEDFVNVKPEGRQRREREKENRRKGRKGRKSWKRRGKEGKTKTKQKS